MTRQLLVSTGQATLHPRVIDVVALVSGLENDLKTVAWSTDRTRTAIRHRDGVRTCRSGALRRGAWQPGHPSPRRHAQRRQARDLVEPGVGGEGDHSARIVIEVADTGIAIAPEVAERLFDPFLTTGIDARTGLELAMAFGVVRQSGGEIEVRARAGGGSTIEIQLPEVAPEQP